MLVVVSTSSLSLVEPSNLKKLPPILPKPHDLSDRPTGCSWAPDNSVFYVSYAGGIQRFDPITTTSKELYFNVDNEPISNIVSPSTESIIFSISNRVCSLESRKAKTLDTHKGSINCLALSVDGQTLASTSPDAVHIHHFETGVTTTLRGLPTEESITSCLFHPHARTRLLVASENQVLVYDTNCPSQPGKVILLDDPGSGSIVGLASSPFSKSLVAAITADGRLGLIDLEKEIPLFRTLDLETNLRTISFSPEGAAIYVGTETGDLLLIDLRALDKQPKIIAIGASQQPIIALSLQRKARATENLKATTSTPRTLDQHTPSRSRAATVSSIRQTLKSSVTPSKSRMTRATSPLPRSAAKSTLKTSLKTSPKPADPPKEIRKVSTPARRAAGSLSESRSQARASVDSKGKAPVVSKAATLAARAKAVLAEGPSSSSRKPIGLSSSSNGKKQQPLMRERANTVSSQSTASTKTGTATSTSRPGSRTTATTEAGSSSPGPSAKRLLPSARAMTPETPDVSTPLAGRPKPMSNLDALGLGTPEVERWIQTGKGKEIYGHRKSKSVGFKARETAQVEVEDKEENENEADKSLVSIHASPQGRKKSSGSMHSPRLPSTTGSSATELLKSIVQDAMYDYQVETKTEMMGLHLDLVRMGRSWKAELRALMDEYVGDLKELREENARLREENMRLRRCM